jgi:MFS family permease
MPTIPSVWNDRDFRRLWAATGVSMLGSFITRTALPFAAILVLGAGAAEVGLIRGAELLAGLVVGLFAGAWVDRLRRRPILIWADLGRAVLLGSVPVAFALGSLTLLQLVVVALGAAILTTFFDTADRAYLPTVIGRGRLVEANATLTGTSATAEFVGFGLSGWLIQWLTAPIAIALDALSFLVSALFLRGIRSDEPAPRPAAQRRHVLTEIREGLAVTLRDPILRPLALADAAVAGFWGVFGSVFFVFATDLGFGPAVIGMVAAVGGLASLAGAAVAGRAVRWMGVGPFLIGTLVLVAIGNSAIALTPDASLVGLVFLLTQQILSDSAMTAYDVIAVSIRQATVDDATLGRVVASFHVLAMAAMLVGTVVGAAVAETLGLRTAMWLGAAGGFLGLLILASSRVRTLRTMPSGLPAPASAVIAGDDVPLAE